MLEVGEVGSKRLQQILTHALKRVQYIQFIQRYLMFIHNHHLSHLQHGFQVISDLERGSSLAADLINRDALSVLDQGQSLSRADVEDSQVGDYLPHATGTGEGEGAFCITLACVLR